MTVTRGEPLLQSAYTFFSVTTQPIVVNGEDVHVFDYPSPARAQSDASKISPTGSPIGQSQIFWVDTPHFYRRDHLIVLYVGHTVGILNALEAVLGPPFAAAR